MRPRRWPHAASGPSSVSRTTTACAPRARSAARDASSRRRGRLRGRGRRRARRACRGRASGALLHLVHERRAGVPDREAAQLGERRGPGDPVGREPGVALEARDRRRAVCRPEDAVDAAGVEAERGEALLELGDVVAPQQRRASWTGRGRRGAGPPRRAAPRSSRPRCRRCAGHGAAGTPRRPRASRGRRCPGGRRRARGRARRVALGRRDRRARRSLGERQRGQGRPTGRRRAPGGALPWAWRRRGGPPARRP